MSRPEPPPFDEPWQAQAFAIAVALNERGLLDWREWTETLGPEIARGPEESGNEAYFLAWLSALEAILVTKRMAGEAEIAGLAAAWRAAARATPHGKPITLPGRG